MGLFEPIEPFNRFHLPVGEGHTLYVEEAGNPCGIPIVFLHGGPGGGFSPRHRQLFDPVFYRIVLFDQRGAGKSTPHAELENNTTWHLVADIETIRTHLNIQQWLVFGGSWGSTLALAYAQTHPKAVTGLILRGIFLTRPSEIDWFYEQGGAGRIFPDLWEKYSAPVSPENRHEMVKAYYALLTHTDESVRLAAARAWSGWETATSRLLRRPQAAASIDNDLFDLAMARIECHYFINNSFFKPDQLLHNASQIQHIPTWIIQGQYDMVCPPQSAWDLYKALPHAQFELIPDAGHAFDEPGILDALIRATNAFKAMLK